MKEIGIDISFHTPKNVDQFLSEQFDYVITVCNHAKEACPVFIGKVKHRLHLGFEDPAEAQGTDEEIIAAFRRIRDEIKTTFSAFYSQTLVREVTS
jgi:arsenate reductase